MHAKCFGPAWVKTHLEKETHKIDMALLILALVLVKPVERGALLVKYLGRGKNQAPFLKLSSLSHLD